MNKFFNVGKVLVVCGCGKVLVVVSGVGLVGVVYV